MRRQFSFQNSRLVCDYSIAALVEGAAFLLTTMRRYRDKLLCQSRVRLAESAQTISSPRWGIYAIMPCAEKKVDPSNELYTTTSAGGRE